MKRNGAANAKSTVAMNLVSSRQDKVVDVRSSGSAINIIANMMVVMVTVTAGVKSLFSCKIFDFATTLFAQGEMYWCESTPSMKVDNSNGKK